MICKPNLQSAKPDAFVAAAFRGGRLLIKTTAPFPPRPPSRDTNIETEQMKTELGSPSLDW
jgi:hypothetical protein